MLRFLPWLAPSSLGPVTGGAAASRRAEILAILDQEKLRRAASANGALGGVVTEGIDLLASQPGNTEVYPAVPGGPGVSEVEVDPATDLGVLRPRRQELGFNAVRVLEYETAGVEKYGSTPALLADLSDLGATYFRQPTNGDLTWPRGVEVPVDAGDGTAIRAALESTSFREDLFELFKALIVHGLDVEAGTSRPRLKVVLTFLNVQSPSGDLVDPAREYLAANNLPPAQRGLSEVGSVVELPWASGHGEASVTAWDGNAYGIEEIRTVLTDTAVTFTGTYGDSTDIVYGGLDPRSPYKLHYVYLVARTMAELLLDVDDEIRDWWAESYSTAAPSLFDYIFGIELFNEVNAKNVVYSGAASELHGALLWAMATREAMRGFQEGLAGVEVDLWLPSLWSYVREERTGSASGLPQAFSNLLWFQRSLALFLATSSVFDAREPYAPAVPDLRWLAKQDYHFYHVKGTERGTTGAAVMRLHAELEELKDTLRRFLEPISGRAATMSVSETGASTHPEDVSENYVWPALTIETETPATDAAFLQRFQAREVWRRLAVALTDAGAAAWHTHMSGNASFSDTGQFRDMGLRIDSTPDAVATAADATTRPSWWAYQRLTTLLTATGPGYSPHGWFSRVLDWPGRSAGAADDYYQGIDVGSANDTLVLVEFYLGAGREFDGVLYRYGYVVFRDPVDEQVERDREGKHQDAGSPLLVSVSNPFGGSVIRVPSVPEGIARGTDGGPTTFSADAPYVDVLGDWWVPAAVVSEGGDVTLEIYLNGPLGESGEVDRALGDPIVLLSEQRLELRP